MIAAPEPCHDFRIMHLILVYTVIPPLFQYTLLYLKRQDVYAED